MKTTLWLIRHGETEWNANGRWQGHTDVPLNDIGRRQAELVAERLRAEQIHFDAIYSSDLSRAFQTAWAVGAALGVPVQLFPPLREIDLGVWSGLTLAEVRERYPVELALLEKGQDIPRGGAETTAAMTKRVSEAVQALAEKHPGETLCLFGHGGSLRALMRQSKAGAMLDKLKAHHLGNTAISVLTWEDGEWDLISYNDMTHLLHSDEPEEVVTTPPDDDQQPTEGYAP
jgi:probable phosphoglycerate mutase